MKLFAAAIATLAITSFSVSATPMKFNCEGVSVVYSPLQPPTDSKPYRPLGLVVSGISATDISSVADWQGNSDDSLQIIGTINGEPVNLMYRPLKNRVTLYSGDAHFECDKRDQS